MPTDTAWSRSGRVWGLAPYVAISAAVAVFGLKGAPAVAQVDPTPSAARVYGCYAIELGEWSEPLGRDAPYHTPPATVFLDSAMVDGSLREPGFRLHPHVGALTRYGPSRRGGG